MKKNFNFILCCILIKYTKWKFELLITYLIFNLTIYLILIYMVDLIEKILKSLNKEI